MPPADVEIERISATVTARMLERDEAILVDVREEDEIRRGMAEPAIWMPLSMIRREEAPWVQFVDDMTKHPGKLVVLYCESGGRSDFVAKGLARLSIPSANLGGYSDWKAVGLPIKTPEQPVPGGR